MICQTFNTSCMALRFSPFDKDLLAVACSDNFGIAGNSKLHLMKFDLGNNSTLPIKTYPMQDAIFSTCFSEQSPNLVSCVTGNGYFKLFNMEGNNPVVDLKAHQKEVHSVACNHFLPFLYLTAGADRNINLIDVQAQKVDLVSGTAHSAAVNQVVWHPRQKNLFASCGKDGRVLLFDLQSKGDKASLAAVEAKDVLSVDFNKYNDTFITGSSDNSIKLYDIRNSKIPVMVMQGHRYAVKNVKFSPFKENLLVSCSL